MSADQGSFGYNILVKKFPKRIINVGIAEQNLIGIAAGLALENKTVFVYAISSFLYSRAYEQIKLNLCSMNLKVCLISSGPGFCYSPDGPTHYSLEDISIYNNLNPNSYLKNLRLINRLKAKEFNPEELADMTNLYLFPENWKEVYDKKEKRDKEEARNIGG